MKIKIFSNILFVISLLLVTANVYAQSPDRYMGDTAIYYGFGSPPPNILFIIDNSTVMDQPGSRKPYSEGTIYEGPYETNRIYTKQGQTVGGQANYNIINQISTVEDICDLPSHNNPQTTLKEYGYWIGKMNNQGACITTGQDNNFYLGNLINYIESDPVILSWGEVKPFEFGDLITATFPHDGEDITRYFQVVEVNNSGQKGENEPLWSISGEAIIDGELVWALVDLDDTIMDIVKDTLQQILPGARDGIRAGLMVFGNNNHGGIVVQPIRDISSATGASNYDSLLTSINNLSSISGNQQPLNEVLWDAGLYYRGDNNTVGNTGKISSDSISYLSPIQNVCQRNFVILISTGNTDATAHTSGRIGDQNSDGKSGYVDDAVKWLYEHAISQTHPGYEKIETRIIQMVTPKVQILESAVQEYEGDCADVECKLKRYQHVKTSSELVEAFLGFFEDMVRPEDTVFVAPVVPANPDNQTHSGNYVYLGLFKPENLRPWSGNLKKFGLVEIDGNLQIVEEGYDAFDPNDPAAGLVFHDANVCKQKYDDEITPTLENGRFVMESCNIRSYWSKQDDGILVNFGGAGENLLYELDEFGNRNIKALVGDNLADFNDTNISAEMLGLTDETQAVDLINFVRGFYSPQGDVGMTVREWVMGDVLHSKPLVVNYDKSDPDKTYIFVGTNGGMLHAFNDQFGSEAWAFIPPEILPRLQYMNDWEHTYLVDGSASIYIHDVDGDGVIGSDINDRAILVFGLRRGGGWQNLDHTDPHGAYYALDVTDPENPEFLWKIDKNTAGFGELAQTWSQPQFAKVKVSDGDNVVSKIVAFIGGGYDNVEDLRFGSTDTYPDVRLTGPTEDFSQGQSSGAITAATAVTRGRGVYAIEMATLASGSINTSNSGDLLWSFADTGLINHSVPSDVLVFDRNGNGFADRLYFSDVGGNVWRTKLFGDASAWETTKIFSSNPGQTNGVNDNTSGRKLFYRLDASVINSQKTMLLFGSGDRAHPLNHQNPGSSGAVIDRLYAVIDYEGYNYVTNGALTEEDLHDVTENVLQQDHEEDVYQATIDAERAAIMSAKGWYIRLDFNPGEKVTAAATIFNNVVYFTTYEPNPYGEESDPCTSGRWNLGTARLYAVNAETGEAVFNFRADNSVTDQHGESQDPGDGPTLRRADRSLDIGIGMPSGVVVVITEEGNAHLLIVVEQEGGGISQFTQEDDSWKSVLSLYWMQW